MLKKQRFWELPPPDQILNSFVQRLLYGPAVAQANSIYSASCPLTVRNYSGTQFLKSNFISLLSSLISTFNIQHITNSEYKSESSCRKVNDVNILILGPLYSSDLLSGHRVHTIWIKCMGWRGGTVYVCPPLLPYLLTRPLDSTTVPPAARPIFQSTSSLRVHTDRPVFWSEGTPHNDKTVSVLTETRIWSTPIWIDWLTVGRNLTLTSGFTWRLTPEKQIYTPGTTLLTHRISCSSSWMLLFSCQY